MTILWQDGFDLYGTSSDFLMSYAGVIPTLTAGSGRFGGGSFGDLSYSNYIVRTLPTTQTEVWTSFAFKPDTSRVLGDYQLCVFGVSGTTNEVWITLEPGTGTFKAFLNGSTLIASGSSQVVSGWHWIDIRVKHATSGGEVEVWLDNTRVFLATGVVTASTSSPLNYITLGGGAYGWFDDWFITDTTTGRLGDTRIETVSVNSDAGPNNGTPSAGTSHFAVVDAANFTTATYLTLADTTGQEELFGHAALSQTPSTVFAVRVIVAGQKSDAGSFAIKPLVVSSGVEADGASQQLLTSYAVQSSIFQTDPNTSAPWTYAAANAAKVGFKVV